jgi:hypothetical protein
MKIYTFLFCVPFLIFNTLTAQDKTGGKFSGVVFGDYFYKVSGDSSGSAGQYSPFKKSYQAFELRRIYLKYDHTFSDRFAAQFLIESTEKTLITGKYGIAVKTAFLEWRNLVPQSSIFIGMIPTPAWGLVEGIWGYRSIEKSIIDFRGLGSAVDVGVSLKGTFDKTGNYGYFVMIGNGTGQKLETNKYKKFYSELAAKPVKGLTTEIYSDFEPNRGDKNKFTFRGFASYQMSVFTAGVEVFQQNQKKAKNNSLDVVPFGVSAFAWATLVKKTKKPNEPILNAFARFDYFDPDTKNKDSGFKENFITLGLDYMPMKNVHVMPNVWINTFKDKSSANVKRDADIVTRLTFFYVYN